MAMQPPPKLDLQPIEEPPTKLDLQPLDLQPIEESVPEKPTVEEPSVLSQAWRHFSEPPQIVTDFARQVSDYITNPRAETSPTGKGGFIDFALKLNAIQRGLQGGSIEGAASLLSPMNVASAGFGGLEVYGAKQALPLIAKMGTVGNKIISAPMIAHGGKLIFDPESTWGERGQGLLEAGGGLLGLFHSPAKVTPQKTTVVPSKTVINAPANAGPKTEVLPSPNEVNRAWVENQVTPEILNQVRMDALGKATDAEIIEGINRINKIRVTRKKFGASATKEEAREGRILQMEANRRGLEPPVPDPFTDPKIPPSPQQLTTEELAILGETKKLATPTATTTAGPIFIIKKEKATPEFVKEAIGKGYKFVGMKDNGDFKFQKLATPVPTPTPIVTPPKGKFSIANETVGGIDPLGAIPPVSGGGKVPPKPPPPPTPITPASSNATPIIRRINDKPPKQAGIISETWNLARGLMSVDLPFITSAGLRQGLPLIGTRNWFKAWLPSFKAYGSKAFYEAHRELMASDPLMQRGQVPVLRADGTNLFKNGRPVLKEVPSIAEQAGVMLTDVRALSAREEAIRSQLAEKIPLYGRVVAASNRAYTAYINDLRLSTFRNFYNAMPDKANIVALKELGDAVNTFTGRGPLKTKIPFTGGKEVSLEKHAYALSQVLFAPKLIASRLQMLNPVNYIMTNPQVRLEYVKAISRTAGAWMTFATVAKQLGAEVSLDPTNSDFGKIKIGNIRLDPGGGFQQFLVFFKRMESNKYTSSITNKTQDMGTRFNGPTRGSIMQNFVANKLHPSAKFFYDAAFANTSRQFQVFDRAAQMAVPMITNDLIDIYKQEPDLLPFLAPLMSGGMGVQSYSRGEFNKPMFISPQNDIVLGKPKTY